MHKYFLLSIIFLYLCKIEVLSQNNTQKYDNIIANKDIVLLGIKTIENPLLINLDSNTKKLMFESKNILQYFNSVLIEYPKNTEVSVLDFSFLQSSDYYLFHSFLFPSFIREFILPNIDTTQEFYILENSYPNYFNRFWSIENNLKWKKSYYRYAQIPHKFFLIVLISNNLLSEYIKTISVDPIIPIKYYLNSVTYYKLAIPVLIESQ